jgi:hypothetical protein
VKLFAIYIGGEHPRANVEVHDVRFIVAASLRDTYDRLRAEWWGTPGTLHIDCWAEIDHVEGFDVELRPEPPTTRDRLFFINLGGYDGQDFAEQHKNLFVVAGSPMAAKAKALASVTGWTDAHRDDLYEADAVFSLDRMIEERLYIHLLPSESRGAPRFTCAYKLLR